MKPEVGQIWINRIGDSVKVSRENGSIHRCDRFDPIGEIHRLALTHNVSLGAFYCVGLSGDFYVEGESEFDLIKRDTMAESTKKRINNLVMTFEGPRYLRHGQIWIDRDGRTVWTRECSQSPMPGMCECYDPWDKLKPGLTNLQPLYYVNPDGKQVNSFNQLMKFVGWWESQAKSDKPSILGPTEFNVIGTETGRFGCDQPNESNQGCSDEEARRQVFENWPPRGKSPLDVESLRVANVAKSLGIPSRRVGCIEPDQPEQIPMAGGKAASTKGPALHLIPTEALSKLADRFELGVIRKGDRAWNALSKNQEVLVDKDFLLERISHIVHHALKLRDKIASDDFAGMREDDDAGAIGWGAIFFLSAVSELLKREEKEHATRNNDAGPAAY